MNPEWIQKNWVKGTTFVRARDDDGLGHPENGKQDLDTGYSVKVELTQLVNWV